MTLQATMEICCGWSFRDTGALVKALLTSLFFMSSLPLGAQGLQTPAELAAIHARDVDKRLLLPADETLRYGALLQSALSGAGTHLTSDQYVILVDRSPLVQALMIYWRPVQGAPLFIGASPVSTGRSGGFEHFLTPVGVFDHTLANPDFRAEGTRNENGIMGYGAKGLRVFDFGWQPAQKTWGNRALSVMRLQMHATDPEHLERRVGSAQSKGCIRIPATLNKLIDQYGLLDADYERAMRDGDTLWILLPERTPTPWSGRYLIVVDTQRTKRPIWSQDPFQKKNPKLAVAHTQQPRCG